MVFNIQKFLTENKLTGQSQMRQEDDNTGLTMSVGDDEEYFDSDSADPYGGTFQTRAHADASAQKADYYKTGATAKDLGDRQEPTSQAASLDRSTGNLYKKELQLKDLEDKKDALVMQLKGNVIGLDQYKQAIGNIPEQIKKLRADLSQAMGATADSDDEMTADDHIG